MHLTTMLGSSFIGALPFFLVLKTFADTSMHIVEHNVFRKGDVTARIEKKFS